MTKIETKKEINQIRKILNIAWQNIYFLLFFLIIFEIFAYYSFKDYNKRTVSHAYRVNFVFFEPREFEQQQEKLFKIVEQDVQFYLAEQFLDSDIFFEEELSDPSISPMKNFNEFRGVLPAPGKDMKINWEYIINEIVKDFTFNVDHFTNNKLVSKQVDKFETRLVFYFEDEVNVERDYKILLNDYLLIQSKRIFQNLRKSNLQDIEIKIIQINNIISFYNLLKNNDSREHIEKLSIDHPIFLPLVNHLNNFYDNINNFPIKFIKLNNISEFPNVHFTAYFISYIFFAIVFFVLFIFLKTLYKNLNDKKS